MKQTALYLRRRGGAAGLWSRLFVKRRPAFSAPGTPALFLQHALLLETFLWSRRWGRGKHFFKL